MNSKKLIYVGDPMCSWCYGIADELETIINQFKAHLSYEIVMGGLRPYNTQKMSELKSFLAEHWHHVNQKSGQKFTYDILDNNEITYDTEPPSRALIVIRELMPEVAFTCFKLIQEAFYLHNKNMHLASSYEDILSDLKIDKDSFKNLFGSEEMKLKTKRDFEKASRLGVRSFPTILLQIDDEYFPIARGYATAKDMSVAIEQYIGK